MKRIDRRRMRERRNRRHRHCDSGVRYVLARSAQPFTRDLVEAAVQATERQASPVMYSPTMLHRQCFNNVADQVARYGGKAVHGWSLIDLHESLAPTVAIFKAMGMPLDLNGIEAVDMETHCVWERPDGTLVDLTPVDGGERCSFVPDARVPQIGLSLIVFADRLSRERYVKQFGDGMGTFKPYELRMPSQAPSETVSACSRGVAVGAVTSVSTDQGPQTSLSRESVLQRLFT